MDTENQQGRPVDVEDLLLRTDWNSVEHCCPNVAPATPVILRRLLDGDASVQGAALRDLYQAVTHQNSFYGATAPAAAFVAEILGDPRTLAAVTEQRRGDSPHSAEAPRFLLRIGLLDWLGSAGEDANEAPVEGCNADVEAFRTLRPTLYGAIHPFLADDEAEVRTAALAALLPLLAAPELTHYVEGLREDARVLAGSTTPYRQRAVNALAGLGEDVTPFRQDAGTHVEVRAHAEGFAHDPPF